MDIDEISSYIEIQRVMHRYSRGVDRADEDLIRSAFHDDAIDEHGVFRGTGYEFASFIVKYMAKHSLPSVHHITTMNIEFQGDKAAVETYYFVNSPNGEGDDEKLVAASGRYVDRFERRDGKWLIAHRLVVVDWSRDIIPGQEWDAASVIVRGSRGRSDPSYEIFKS